MKRESSFCSHPRESSIWFTDHKLLLKKKIIHIHKENLFKFLKRIKIKSYKKKNIPFVVFLIIIRIFVIIYIYGSAYDQILITVGSTIDYLKLILFLFYVSTYYN
jgi:hypothetical protein